MPVLLATALVSIGLGFNVINFNFQHPLKIEIRKDKRNTIARLYAHCTKKNYKNPC